MKNKTKKVITHEQKEAKLARAKLLERESNITLVSVTVAIVSFMMMLYVNNAVNTNYLVAQSMCSIIKYILLISAVGTAVVAFWKKKYYLIEYTVFTFVLAIGYYLIEYPGISGIPFIYKETANGIIITEFGMKIAKYFQTKYIVYALWAVNVIYCVFSIVFHSIKYTRIRKIKTKEQVNKA